MLTCSQNWLDQARDHLLGVLAVDQLSNPAAHPALNKTVEEWTQKLQDRYQGFDREDLRETPVLAAYHEFYQAFRKTYHVQLQLESVVFHEKPIRSPSSVVTAMFLAELASGLLTAVHDLDSLTLPLQADLAQGNEVYQTMAGEQKKLKPGDLFIRDQEGIISSVIYGPDRRTRVHQDTTGAVFTTYGMPGIGGQPIRSQLNFILDTIHLFAPDARQLELKIEPR